MSGKRSDAAIGLSFAFAADQQIDDELATLRIDLAAARAERDVNAARCERLAAQLAAAREAWNTYIDCQRDISEYNSGGGYNELGGLTGLRKRAHAAKNAMYAALAPDAPAPEPAPAMLDAPAICGDCGRRWFAFVEDEACPWCDDLGARLVALGATVRPVGSFWMAWVPVERRGATVEDMTEGRGPDPAAAVAALEKVLARGGDA